uniref:Reverse transcriptase domain-containing protein n=1 Tax=Fagus sylvatica TaxID=28930 RepID=A0A2N9HSR5_FAGSY
MGGVRSFRIESKRFDLIREGDGLDSVSLIESRAIQETFGIYGQGRSPMVEKVTDYGRGGCKGRLAIPEGQNQSGWRGFNKELALLLTPIPVERNQPRQGYTNTAEDDTIKRISVKDRLGPMVSYADSLRIPTSQHQAGNSKSLTSQDSVSKSLKSPEIMHPKDIANGNEGGKAKFEEKFLGVNPFRRSGKDMAYPNLKILVNVEGKRTVQKPNMLARVAPEEMFSGLSQFEWRETSTEDHKPKQVWVPKRVSGGPLVTAQSLNITNDAVTLMDTSRGSLWESTRIPDIFIQELTWLKFQTRSEGGCRSFRLDYNGGFNFSVPRNIVGCWGYWRGTASTTLFLGDYITEWADDVEDDVEEAENGPYMEDQCEYIEGDQSEWVRQNMEAFSKQMGVSIEGCEIEAMTLFTAIEQRWRLKRSQIKNALKLWKGEVICLQETKLENISRSVVRSLWSNRFADWKFLESEGASGGILLMWDNRVTEVQDCVKGQFSISCRFKNVQDQFEWAFSGVYGGDFNVVRFPSEKLRAGRLTRAMTTFSDFIAELRVDRSSSSGRRFLALYQITAQFPWIVAPTFGDEIREGIVAFYKDLYSEREHWRPVLGGLEFSSLEAGEATHLERPFSEEEVVLALNQISGEKAPGPDGFTLAFFHHCWDVVKKEVLDSIQELRDVLGSLLSPTQNAFIQGRQIQDSMLIANESLDSRIKSDIPGLICKLDLEKAYDHVSWSFLMYLLERCGFGVKWRNWIHFCISSVRFSVLINGTPCGFFPSSRGLRQGDSLSPMLFVLVMEALSRLMDRAVDRGYLEGFSVDNSNAAGLKVSHMLFADDTLVFCGATRDQLYHLKGVMLCFEAVSGLRINLGKSEIVPVGPVADVENLVQVLGGRVGSLPMKYLGLPLGARYKSKEIWNPILEKMERRLAGWKRSYLSKGGRLTLIKSTLSSLPTYFLSLFAVPASVLTGLRNFNEIFFGVIVCKYGCERDGWHSKEGRGRHGVCLWKHIQAGWSRFSRYVQYTVGSGDSVRFWVDRWSEEGLLREIFPAIYQIALHKQATVSEYLSWHQDDMVWTVTLQRSLQDWELGELLTFHNTTNFPWRSIWQSRVPHKVAVFSWLVAQGKILTLDNLRRRRIWVLDWCFMCKRAGESVNHLMIHCEYAQELWSMIFCLFGVSWAMPQTTYELLHCWRRKGPTYVVWNAIPSCLMWLLWRERNQRAFEDAERHSADLKLILIRTLMEWTAAISSQSFPSVFAFIDGCM